MSKQKRGKNAKRIANWRGTCPACKRTGVKLLWSKNDEAGAKMNVCKICG